MVELSDIIAVVVDDEPLNAALLQKMLLMLGIGQVTVCTSAAETLRVATDLPRVDLVLLDIQLPDEDGFELLRHLRTMPHLKNTHYVAVTANVLASYLARAKELDFDGFLGKPFKFDEFRTQVIDILDGKHVWAP